MNQIKRYWKQIILLAVAVAATIIGMVTAFATDVILTIGEENTRAELRYTVQVLKRLIRCKEAALRP